MQKTTPSLLKEQVQLFAIEQKLTKLLPKIQESLNALKVEELHFKAQSIQDTVSAQPAETESPITTTHHTEMKPDSNEIEKINEQDIDLDFLLNTSYDESESD